MGRSRTFKYVLVIETVLSRAGRVSSTPMEWKKEYGLPTVENIAKWVEGFEKSCQTGGCNSHLGYDPVVSATIQLNDGSRKMVEIWIRKTHFQVIP